MTQALILVGGQGTRLRPLTCRTPKAMVPVLNIPFIEHVIRNLEQHGIKDIILAQHHLPASMAQHFGDGENFGVKLTYIMEETPRGTGGAIKNAEHLLTGTFLVLNGDIYQSRNFTEILKFHRDRKSRVTITLTPVDDPTAYGVVETGPGDRVRRFLEKPKREEVTTNMINAGTYVLDRDLLSRMPAGVKYSIEREFFPAMLAEGQPFYGYRSPDYWMDTGTPEKYLQLHRDLLAEAKPNHSVVVGRDARVHTGVDIKGRVIIGERCEIEAGAALTGPLVIGARCQIGRDAKLADSVLWDGVVVGAGVEITGCVIAAGCNIGANARLQDAVAGENVVLPANCTVMPGTKLWPEGESE